MRELLHAFAHLARRLAQYAIRQRAERHADGTSFYATIRDDSGGPSIVRIPAAGGSPVVLVHGDGGAIAVDDQCLYWAGSAGIFSVAKTAEGPFG